MATEMKFPQRERELVTFSIRIDKRISDKLDELGIKADRKRNRMIEHLLADATGLTSVVFPLQDERV